MSDSFFDQFDMPSEFIIDLPNELCGTEVCPNQELSIDADILSGSVEDSLPWVELQPMTNDEASEYLKDLKKVHNLRKYSGSVSK